MSRKRDKKQIARNNRGNSIIATQETIEDSSPFPLASEMEKYKEIDSSAPNRILTFIEKNRDFVEDSIKRHQSHTFFFRILLVVVAFAAVIYCAYLGHQWAAGAIGVAATGTGVFLFRKNLS